MVRIPNLRNHMRKPLLSIALFLAFSTLLSAQTADEIIAKHLDATGGLAKIKAVKTRRLTGSFEVNGMQAGFVELESRPDKLRREIAIQNMTMIQAYDGKTAWQVIPFTGKKDPEAITGDELRQFREEADMDGSLAEYKQKGSTVELVGREQFNGADAFNIKLTLKTGEVRNFYLDASSFLQTGVSGKAKRDGKEFEVKTSLTDYKDVQGVMYPFTIESNAGEQGSAKVTLQKIEVNVPVEDSAFKMPPAAATAAPRKP